MDRPQSVDHPRMPAAALVTLEAVPDGVVIVDRHARIIFVSQQACRLFGYPADELVGNEIHMLVPEPVQQVHRAHTTRFLARPQRRPMGEHATHLAGRRRDGSEFPVEISLSHFELDGALLVIASVRDISERLESEADARAIQESLDKVADATLLFDAETLEILHANEGAVHQTGYRREELTGMVPVEFLPELQREFASLVSDIAARRRQTVTMETSLRRKDGADLVIDLSMQMPDEAVLGGRPCVMAIAHDVTERKEIEARVSTSERFFRATFEDAPLPVFTLDMGDAANRIFLQVNQATEVFLGYSSAELVGTSIATYVREDFRPDSIQFADAAKSNTYQSEIPFIRRDGTTAWGDLTARRIDINNDAIRLVHLQDVTRRKEAEWDRDRREAQLALLADVRQKVMSDEPLDLVLAHICQETRAILDAAAVTIALPGSGDTLDITATATMDGQTASRRSIPIDGSFIGAVFTNALRGTSNERLTVGVVGERVGQPMVTASGAVEGVLVAAPKASAQVFNPADNEVLVSIASEAAVAIELARARSDRRRLLVVEDRERIARDLHDVVIQRLFAAGMGLQSALGSPQLETRVLGTINDLDDTIRSVRDSIFRLVSTPTSLEEELQRVLDRFRSDTTTIGLSIEGNPSWVNSICAPHLIPVTNELVSNAIRHGGATRISVEVDIDRGEQISIRVEDNGSGFDSSATTGGLGLGNLTERAYSLNGTFQLVPGPVAGAIAVWSAPMSADTGDAT